VNVLFVSAEVAPLVKVGGLADVAGSLPAALRRLGHDVRIVMPRYRRIRTSNLPQHGPVAATFVPANYQQEELRVFTASIGETPVYLLDIPAGFEREAIYGDGDEDRRFVLFMRGVMLLMQHMREMEKWQPDVLHCNDWHTALLPNYLKTFYSYTFGHVASVFTIHNLAYQGWYGAGTRMLAGVDDWGENYINFMARGIAYADIISTVSPTYANEILTPEYGERLDTMLRTRQDRLVGVLNGIDFDFFNPATDTHIAANYSLKKMAGKAACKAALQRELGWAPDPNRPLLAMVTRLAEQKGLDLVDGAVPWLLSQTNAQLVLLGTGSPHLEGAFANHAWHNPGRINLQRKFDAALAQRIYAGSDLFLMPSRYEPGGLGQLIALRYGSVPVVRATGGLNDTVREGYDGNGFRFHPYEVGELIGAIQRALSAYRDPMSWALLRERGMREDHSWEHSAHEYVAMYERALQAIGR
jgi:starch synthase